RGCAVEDDGGVADDRGHRKRVVARVRGGAIVVEGPRHPVDRRRTGGGQVVEYGREPGVVRADALVEGDELRGGGDVPDVPRGHLRGPAEPGGVGRPAFRQRGDEQWRAGTRL